MAPAVTTPEQAALTNSPRAFAETWAASVAQLRADARALPERVAFLDPAPVPDSLLDQQGRAALDELVTCSLATPVKIETRWGEVEGFVVHRLVQDVTRRSLDAAAAKQRLTEGLQWVNGAFTGEAQDVRNWPRLDPLAPHARAVAAFAGAAEIWVPTSRLINVVAMLLKAKELHAEAEPLMRRALEIGEASVGAGHPNVAIHLNNIAQLLKDTNRLAEAGPLMRHHLAIFFAFGRQTGHADPHRDAAIGNYTALLRAMGHNAAAIVAEIGAVWREAERA